MNERRDYQKHGRGRRDYDKDMEAFCLHCDLRKEVQSKVSWKMFFIIVGGILAIVGTFTGIGIPVANNAFIKVLGNSEATLEAVHAIGNRTTRIETRQEIIMDDVKQLKRTHSVDTDRGR